MTPLSLPVADWPSRWLVFVRWDLLHRVAEIEWDDFDPGEKIAGVGKTVCGRRGRLAMPGCLSRMYLPRCPLCCRRLGIPEGDGNPFNAGMREEGDPPADDRKKKGKTT